jgi:hypothetical protein
MVLKRRPLADIEFDKAQQRASGVPASQIVANPFTEVASASGRKAIQSNVVGGANPITVSKTGRRLSGPLTATQTRAAREASLGKLRRSAQAGGRPASTIFTPGQDQKQQQRREEEVRRGGVPRPVTSTTAKASDVINKENLAATSAFQSQRESQRTNIVQNIVKAAEQSDPELKKLIKEKRALIDRGIWGRTGAEKGIEERMSAARDRVVANNADIIAFDEATPGLQQGAIDALGTTAARTRGITTGSAGVAPEEQVAAFLNLPEGQTVRFKDGRFEVVATDDLDFEPDPRIRAEKRLERKRQEGLQDLNARFDPAIDRLEGETLLSGKTPTQVQKQIDKLKRDKNRAVERLEANVGDLQEDILVEEQSRQGQIAKGIAAASTPEKQLQKAQSTAMVNRINAKLESGEAIDALQAESLVKADLARESDVGAQNFQSFRAYVASPQGQAATPAALFAEAKRISLGDNDAANKLLAAVADDQFADDAQADWLDSRGVASGEERERSKKRKQLNKAGDDILAGGGDGFGNDVSDMILEYGKLDPTGFLQEEFLMNVKASPDTNFREKTIADLGLKTLENKRFKEMGDIEERIKQGVATPEDITRFNVGSGIIERSKKLSGFVGSGETPQTAILSTSEIAGMQRTSPVEQQKQSLLARVRNAQLTKTEIPDIEQLSLQQGWNEEFKQAVEEGKPVKDGTAEQFNLPLGTTRGQFNRIIKQADEQNFGNQRFQRDFNRASTDIEKAGGEQLRGFVQLGERLQKIVEIKQELRDIGGGTGPLAAIGRKVQRGIVPGTTKELRLFNELQALSGENLVEFVKKISGVAVSEKEFARLKQIKPNVSMDDRQFDDQMARMIEEYEASVLAKVKRFGFSDAERMIDVINGSEVFVPNFKETFTGGAVQRGGAAIPQAGAPTTSVSAGFESGNDPKAFNAGENSFGTFQMRENTANGFAQELGMANTDPNSEGFKQEWDAKVDEMGPEAFQQQEAAFIEKTHFTPQVNLLRENKVPDEIINNPVIQELILSTAVQHGGDTDVIIKALTQLAGSGQPVTIESIVNAVIEERKTRFPSSSPETRANVQSRLDREKGVLTPAT